MAEATFDSPIKEIEGEQVTLSTSASHTAIKPGFHECAVYCPSSWRMALSPKLLHVLYYNGTTYTDYVQYATDRLSTTHVPLDGMTTAHRVYLGTTEPVLGFYFDIGTNPNAATATLDVEYCSTAIDLDTEIVFTDVSGDSDGTKSPSTVTLAVDGAYVFTLPAIKNSHLGTYLAPTYSKCYWTRFTPSATLSAAVDLNEIVPIYKNVNYKFMKAGIEYQFSINTAKVGGIVHLATAGAPVLDIDWIKH